MKFGRLERREAPKPMGEINMTPLIDVMLVLLVIFIIAAPLMGSALKLNLPRSDAAAPGPGARFIALSITPEGDYQVGEEKLDAPAVRERLQQVAERQPDAELRLSADRDVPYGRVAQLIGWAQSAGLNRIAFVAENGEGADAPRAPAATGKIKLPAEPAPAVKR
ncbi:MAG: biopolymer transporter ExbD [Mitsuaria chitosanitabida]|jgi:biopolymer transport protein ExbD/biopolymer transport protein TolR|uniref:ExbD/TolR family protein n=1 Tax=Roseateles chitosanitabidus TaxID=65048 RepID=UPI001B11D1D3|nr:biopolymer transporter ExbD [Roseateles chitosanitabidus]MBO9686701.1 biopolymer transporter ExbD [Roseateles chitosanitabidus]